MHFNRRHTAESATEEAVQPLTGGNGDAEECLSGDQSPPAQEEGALSWRYFLFKVLFSVSLFLLLTLLLEKFAEEPVTKASERLMSTIGLPGLFAAVFAADGLPQPFTYVPLIFMAVKGSVPKPVVFGICAAASYSAGLVGYFVGSFIKAQRNPTLDDFLKKLASPAVLEMMTRRGALGVAFAALMPIPLAIATWTAGYLGVSFHEFLPAPLGRLPKIAIFVLLSREPQAGSSIIEDTVVDQ